MEMEIFIIYIYRYINDQSNFNKNFNIFAGAKIRIEGGGCGVTKTTVQSGQMSPNKLQH